mmetsp:Transcript_7248/g.14846  ORF Transcript_7248/g.14846 Transcript_7248/m.14846 type:complete len:258 (-) Transcript_7248:270-1043(-)
MGTKPVHGTFHTMRARQHLKIPSVAATLLSPLLFPSSSNTSTPWSSSFLRIKIKLAHPDPRQPTNPAEPLTAGCFNFSPSFTTPTLRLTAVAMVAAVAPANCSLDIGTLWFLFEKLTPAFKNWLSVCHSAWLVALAPGQMRPRMMGGCRGRNAAKVNSTGNRFPVSGWHRAPTSSCALHNSSVSHFKPSAVSGAGTPVAPPLAVLPTPSSLTLPPPLPPLLLLCLYLARRSSAAVRVASPFRHLRASYWIKMLRKRP